MPTPPFARAARATRSVEEHRAAVAELLAPAPGRAGSARRARGRVLAEDLVARRAAAVRQLRDGRLRGARRRRRRRDRSSPVDAAGRRRHPGRPHRRPAAGARHRPPDHDRRPAARRRRRGRAGRAHRRRPTTGCAMHRPLPRRARRSAGPARTSPPAQVVLPAGTVLGAAADRRRGGGRRGDRCRCAAARRVLVLSTGSELVAPGTPAAAGPDLRVERPDARRRGARRAAASPSCCASSPTTSRSLLARARRAAGRRRPSTSSLTSGGVSAGAYEVVKDALRRPGRGVRQGRDAAGQAAGRRATGRAASPSSTLPGNPVSSHVSFEVFVRPVLRAALGHPHPDRPRVAAPAGRRADVAGRTPPVPPRRARRRRGYRPARSAARPRTCSRRWPGPTACSWSRRRSTELAAGVAGRGVAARRVM